MLSGLEYVSTERTPRPWREANAFMTRQLARPDEIDVSSNPLAMMFCFERSNLWPPTVMLKLWKCGERLTTESALPLIPSRMLTDTLESRVGHARSSSIACA